MRNQHPSHSGTYTRIHSHHVLYHAYNSLLQLFLLASFLFFLFLLGPKTFDFVRFSNLNCARLFVVLPLLLSLPKVSLANKIKYKIKINATKRNTSSM